ncbi:MAG TPA: hypothetical protein VFG10_18995 [Saprospiraceae bacterium]|nr:hypothetical protein [Saprospiraceae bacterium]
MPSTIITAPNPYNLTRNPIFVTVESSEFTGSAGAYIPSQPNLSCRLEIWRVDSGGDVLIDTLRGPYSSIDKRITFDVSKCIPRVPEFAIPSEFSISVVATPQYAEAVGMTIEFYFKHADQYGDPVTPEALETSDTYLAIHGGLPADHVQSLPFGGYGIGMHSYYFKRDSAAVFLKPVSPEQPDWIYFISLVSSDIRVEVTVRYDDGTSSFYNSVLMDEITAGKAYWVQSGYEQLHVADHLTVGKTPIGYNVSLQRGITNFFTVFYVLDQICSPWERVMLMYNGFGGFESVRFRGPVRHADRVERETFRRTRWTDFTIRDGDINDFRTEGTPIVTLNTGQYPVWYINHLRQLIRGQLWMIDVEEMRFKRIRCETNALDLYDESAPPYNIEITISNAYLDDGFNIY